MKKLLLLCLVLFGGVMQMSATDYVVAGVSAIANGHEWDYNANDNIMTHKDGDWYYLVVENCVLYKPTNEYANEYNWQVVEKGTWEGFKTNVYGLKVSEDGTYTLIFRVNVKTKEQDVIPIKNLTLSNNYGNNNTWNTDNPSFHFTYSEGTKWTIDVNSNALSSSWRFRIWTSGIKNWDGWHNIAPSAEGSSLNLATNADASYAENNTDHCWEVGYPSYPFSKYTISAEYDVVAGKWVVRADAYISKTVVNNDYATLGCSVPLDITSLPTGITAYTLSTTGTTINKVQKTTTLLANKGVLLENTSGENKTLSIPVAASGTADANNQLVAFTGSGNLTQPEGGNTYYYILTDMNNKVGFYKVNKQSGNAMGANTAYLVVDGSSLARDFFALDGETTGIANVDVNDNFDANAPMYNLAGQRVSKNYKGVVIVNGKKMLNK